MTTRFTKDDIELLNSALALFEAEHEGEEPDGYRDDKAYAGKYAEWKVRLDRIRALRGKVHERLR